MPLAFQQVIWRKSSSPILGYAFSWHKPVEWCTLPALAKLKWRGGRRDNVPWHRKGCRLAHTSSKFYLNVHARALTSENAWIKSEKRLIYVKVRWRSSRPDTFECLRTSTKINVLNCSFASPFPSEAEHTLSENIRTSNFVSLRKKKKSSQAKFCLTCYPASLRLKQLTVAVI